LALGLCISNLKGLLILLLWGFISKIEGVLGMKG
jgi:hypothetical protein